MIEWRHLNGGLSVVLGLIVLIGLLVFARVLDKERFVNSTEVNWDDFIYDRVVIVGVDGAGNNFKDADMPNVEELAKLGAVNYYVRTSEPTISAQCWGSLMTGVSPETHGLTNEIVESTPYDISSDYPTIFRIIRENNADAGLASFCGWKPINTGIVEDGIDVEKGFGTDEEVAALATDYIRKNDPELLFVHLDQVDAAGHSYGYKSEEYFTALSMTDKYIGEIYEALEERGMLDSTLFVVTADHGGVGTSHGGSSSEERFVMYLAVGKTVRKGGIIEQMNIRDNAAVVLRALGYEVPANITGKVPHGLF